MKIILEKLELTNFKGISGSWDFPTGKTVFLGKNKTGKTTLFDASIWLLFGKDSLGNTKFDIKTIVNGETMSKGSHEVTGRYVIVKDDNLTSIAFTRAYSEKWTTTRGKQTSTFSGHQTEYKIDDVPVGQKEYNDYVESFFGSEKYRLCTDPMYFTSLKWEKRREILTELAGELDRDALVGEIEGLKDLLGDRSIEDSHKIAVARRKKVGEELKTIPARIDEHLRDSESYVSVEEAEKAVEKVESEISRLKLEISNFGMEDNSDEQILSLTEQLKVEQEKFISRKEAADEELRKRKKDIYIIESEIKNNEDDLEDHKELIENLRKEFITIRDSSPDDGHPCMYYSEKCPYHGQSVPADIRDSISKEFMKNRSEALKKNQIRGKEVAAEIKRIEDYISNRSNELESLMEIETDSILKEESTPAIENLRSQVAAFRAAKNSMIPPKELTGSLRNAEENLRIKQNILATAKAHESSKERIANLENQMEGLSAENDRLEKFFYLYDEYNKLLAAKVEADVSEMFEYVNFRMFKEQINGGIMQCCDVLGDNNVPYETGLNHGDRIKAGLDIIKTLSKRYDFQAPIWIDNAEAVTDLPEIDSQVIALYVSESHETLTQE